MTHATTIDVLKDICLFRPIQKSVHTILGNMYDTSFTVTGCLWGAMQGGPF